MFMAGAVGAMFGCFLQIVGSTVVIAYKGLLRVKSPARVTIGRLYLGLHPFKLIGAVTSTSVGQINDARAAGNPLPLIGMSMWVGGLTLMAVSVGLVLLSMVTAPVGLIAALVCWAGALAIIALSAKAVRPGRGQTDAEIAS